MYSRRTFALAGGAALALPRFAWADKFPDKPVRLVVMIAPGTATDVLTRAVATQMSKQWNIPVLVDNKAGAGGVIGTDFVAKSAPDGYTVLVTNGGHYANAALNEALPYNAQGDFAPVAQFALSALVVAVSVNSPYHTMQELIAAAKQHPGTLSYSSAGNGSASHLAGALMASMANISLKHIPYKSASQAVVDGVSGQIDIVVNGMSGTLPLSKADKLRPLAVTSLKRSALLPNVPTLDEVGLAGYELISPIFALVRVGTPAPVVQSIASALTAAAASPEFKELCQVQGLDVDILDTAALQTAVPKEFAKWKKLVAMAGAKAG